MKIILASKSPRRRELLNQIGLQFEITPAEGEEKITETVPEQAAKELSLQKALEIAKKVNNGSHGEECMIIGADTVVACDGTIFGKPVDKEDAFKMLQLLQGRTHSVYTGVTLVFTDREVQEVLSFAEETRVTFYKMTDQEIHDYIKTGEPMDKAGAYGIQGCGATFIKEIQGDYNNVVGLPVARIYQELKKRQSQ